MASTVTVNRLADHSFTRGTLADVCAPPKGPGIVWVDVVDPDAGSLAQIAEQCGIPPLVVEDMLEDQKRPKIDLYPDLVFFVWIVPTPVDADMPIRSLEFDDVCFVMAERVVITTRRCPVPAIEALLEGKVKVSSTDPAWLVHTIVDRSTDDLIETVDSASDKLDALEDQVMERADQTQLQLLYAVKRQLLQLRRVVQGEREVVRQLTRAEAWVGRDAYMYYEDVGDHLSLISDEIDTYFDVATGIMDIYLSAQSNRMNEIMKQLTVVATIFMPLTLISGIYGMNLIPGMWPRPIYDIWGFAAVCASMVVIALSMLWWFRRKKWW